MRWLLVPLFLSHSIKRLCFYLIFDYFFFFLVASTSVTERSLFTVPHCSLDQRPPAAGLPSSPWNIPQQAVTADQPIRLCLGGSRAGYVLDASVGDPAHRWGAWRDWGPGGWRMKVYVMSEVWQDRCAVTGVELVPKAATAVPTQTRSEVPTCPVLTVPCALMCHRTDQNYCRSNVLVSSLGSLCWLLTLGNSSICKTDCISEV